MSWSESLVSLRSNGTFSIAHLNMTSPFRPIYLLLFLVFCSFVTVQSASWVSYFGSSLVRLLYPAEDGKSTLSLISSSAVPLYPLWSRAPFRSHFHTYWACSSAQWNCGPWWHRYWTLSSRHWSYSPWWWSWYWCNPPFLRVRGPVHYMIKLQWRCGHQQILQDHPEVQPGLGTRWHVDLYWVKNVNYIVNRRSSKGYQKKERQVSTVFKGQSFSMVTLSQTHISQNSWSS